MSSTYTQKAPIVNRFVDLSICRIGQDNFYYDGKIDGKKCSFKIDTDVSIFNEKLVNRNMRKIRIKNCNLRYPTGEKILVKKISG